jgi:molecular chaperone DnaJ
MRSAERKNYYAILGVARTASSIGIRAAYRELAKAHHPDRVGPQRTYRFQEIAEAYGVLSDPAARKDYNRELHRTESQTNIDHTSQENMGMRRFHAEQESATPNGNSVRSGRIFAQWFRRQPRSSAPPLRGGDRFRINDLEVILTREEAVQGGVLSIPVPVCCPSCMGVGHTGLRTCVYCVGRGKIASRDSIPIYLPSHIVDGMLLEVPVTSPHLGELLFRLVIRIK